MATDINPEFIAYKLEKMMHSCPGINDYYALAVWGLAIVYFVVLLCVIYSPTMLVPMLVLGGHVPLAIFLLPAALCSAISMDPLRGWGLFMISGQTAWIAAIFTVIGLRLERTWLLLSGLAISLSWPAFVLYVFTMWDGFF